MMKPDARDRKGAAVESLQDNLSANEPRIFAAYGMIGGVLLFGGIGYALDRWLGTLPLFLLIGLLVGLAVGFYGLVRSINL